MEGATEAEKRRLTSKQFIHPIADKRTRSLRFAEEARTEGRKRLNLPNNSLTVYFKNGAYDNSEKRF